MAKLTPEQALELVNKRLSDLELRLLSARETAEAAQKAVSHSKQKAKVVDLDSWKKLKTVVDNWALLNKEAEAAKAGLLSQRAEIEEIIKNNNKLTPSGASIYEFRARRREGSN